MQWGVSRPDYMDALVAIVPLAKTPAWSAAVVEASRKAIMEDPDWKEGTYDAPPEKGVRLWRDIVNLLAARTPEIYSAQFKNPLEVLPWLTEQENAMMKAFDANDWIYQGWAYERHDVGGTPGFNGDKNWRLVGWRDRRREKAAIDLSPAKSGKCQIGKDSRFRKEFGREFFE